MRKPPGIALMIGIAPQGHGQFGNDEDSLDREGHGDDGKADIATEAICLIIRRLHQSGPAAVRELRQFCDGLEGMCQSFMDKDRKGVEECAEHALEALQHLMEEFEMGMNDDLQRWRAERKQRDIAYRVDQIRSEHAQVARERDIALANNNLEEAELRDMDCEQLEQEFAQYQPPQQPQLPVGITRWAQRNPRFFERHGLQASAAVDGVLGYMMRPKNPVTNRPDATGMGMRREQIFNADGTFTPNGRDTMESLLQMDGPQYFNVQFDPQEKTPDWHQAAKASGIDQKTYLAAYNDLKKQGRVS